MADIRMHRVTEAGPVHDEREIDAVLEVLRSGLLDLGPRVAEFERRGAELLAKSNAVMVNSGTYAEIVDRHVELYSRLYWWGSVLDESDPLEEHLNRPRLSRLSPATQASGPIEDEWLRDNLVAIAQLAESLDRSSFELAMRIVPFEWWAAQLPDRPSTVENHGT